MARFKYKVKKTPREVVEGVIEADSEDQAVARLNEQGFFPILLEPAVSEDKTPMVRMPFFKRVPSRDINIFTRELADLLEAGFPLLRALNILYEQTDNRSLKNIIDDISTVVKEGGNLSAGLSAHQDVFSNIYVNMVRAGEAGGTLKETLEHLTDFFDKEEEFKAKVQQVMAYPIFLSAVGIITIMVLMTFVIPKLVVMFEETGQALPLPTAILISISRAVRDFWWVIAGFIAGLYYVLKEFFKSGTRKIMIDAFKLKIPVLGPILNKIEIARAARTLSVLLSSGISILNSIDIAAQTVQNEVIKGELKKMYSDVKEGSTIAKSIIGSKNFPVYVTNMIAVGEETGGLEESLLRIASSFTREVEKSMRIMMSLLEPAMILLMGSIVGFIVISMLLPIFQYSTIIR